MRTKPKPKAKPSASRYVAPRKPELPTKDELLTIMGEQFDAIDAIMAARPAPNGSRPVYDQRTDFHGYSHSHDKMRTAKAKLMDAHGLLDKLLTRGIKADDETDYTGQAIRAMSRQLHEPASWSRPGRFLLWVEDIPLRIEWGGILLTTRIFALDPRRMFLTETGMMEVTPFSIPYACRTPQDFVKAGIFQKFEVLSKPPVPLSQQGVEAVKAFISSPDYAPWAEQIAFGPVDPISVPLNLPPVQTKLFAVA